MASNNVVVKALSDRQKWAYRQGDAPLWPNGPTAIDYVNGLVRKPGMGSYVLSSGVQMENLYQVEELFSTLNWVEHHPVDPKPGNTYYQAKIDDESIFSAFQGACLLGTLDVVEVKTVRVRKGPHGLELYMEGGKPQRTSTITAIVDGDGLVTWHPGATTPPLDLAKATVKLA
jgi:hypothetical protein